MVLSVCWVHWGGSQRAFQKDEMAETGVTAETAPLTGVMVNAGPSPLRPSLGLSAGALGHSMRPELRDSIALTLLSWPLRFPKTASQENKAKAAMSITGPPVTQLSSGSRREHIVPVSRFEEG